ncbi:hypothetical protein ONZ45_g3293 [Pleurotus djamor]|nr:hypothetical protein ONZ45_g3293 [Pleurotus djamor]
MLTAPLVSALQPLKSCNDALYVAPCGIAAQSANNEIGVFISWSRCDSMLGEAAVEKTENWPHEKLDNGDRCHDIASMPPSAIESHTHLAHSLVRYLGVSSPEGLSPFGITSAGDLVDILSRFTTNAFNVSSPSLEPIGVCVSPPVALINHSCDPNAVIVFPRVSDSPDKEPQMQIIAIRPISAGEEVRSVLAYHCECLIKSNQVLTAYIDTRVPKSMRQAALQQTYNFTCKCKLCSIDGVDPRAAMWCPKSCGGICPLPISDSDIVRCNKCNAVVKSTEAVIDAVRVSQEGLDKATALEVKDPEKSQQLVNNLIPILVSAGLTPSSHPLLAMSHLQQTLLITSFNESFNSELTTSENERKAAQDVLDNAIRAANRHVTGLASVLPEGHPIRAIALAELGKLLVVDEPAPKRADNQNGHPLPQSYGVVPSYPPSGPPRLKLAYDTLLQAHKELLIGFGKTNEGGLVGKEIRQTLTAIEKELGVWKQGIRNVIEDQPRPSK